MGIYSSIIDSHFHTVAMAEKGIDVTEVYKTLFSQDFEGGIDIGCTHNDLVQRYEILKDYPKILLAGAMGPWESGKSETLPPEPEMEFVTEKSMDTLQKELGILEANLVKYKASFLGEIGLDWYWQYGNMDKQLFLFESQMDMADRLGLPVLIHDRDADNQTIEVIRKKALAQAGIIHCFDGSPELMKEALDLGYFISFAGNVTFKKNQNLRDMLSLVPKDRLLLETDAPYLSPVPKRGQVNSPLNVIHTYACAASVLGMNIEDLAENVLENYRSLISRIRKEG